MSTRFGAIVLAMALAPAVMIADGQGRAAQRPKRVTAINATCASDLGMGAKTKRRFCDVIIASTPAESVSVALPPHNGAATLMFDLHNRFDVPAATAEPAQAFVSQTAIVAVIRLTGDVIERAGVSREYRSPRDLFDRLAGSGRGAPMRSVAPGYAQEVRIVVPATVNILGIVGTRLEQWRATARGAFDTPNKPIAMVSNLRVEYTPK
jgi:hypothetical protein